VKWVSSVRQRQVRGAKCPKQLDIEIVNMKNETHIAQDIMGVDTCQGKFVFLCELFVVASVGEQSINLFCQSFCSAAVSDCSVVS
jgi:hypothetical protein